MTAHAYNYYKACIFGGPGVKEPSELNFVVFKLQTALPSKIHSIIDINTAMDPSPADWPGPNRKNKLLLL
jgi:hypothetical protein